MRQRESVSAVSHRCRCRSVRFSARTDTAACALLSAGAAAQSSSHNPVTHSTDHRVSFIIITLIFSRAPLPNPRAADKNLARATWAHSHELHGDDRKSTPSINELMAVQFNAYCAWGVREDAEPRGDAWVVT